ncbi:MAG TPA: glycosyltransferase family 4 protein [Candidatus Saccharimonadales bacterium]|nr:glycosyltransferase family 4 protein [Candidatus Saccharimonadales bacterium]
MKYRPLIKKTAKKVPVVRGIVSEREKLRELTKDQQKKINNILKQKDELQRKLNKEINDRKNPKLTQNYKYSTNELFQITKEDIIKSQAATSGKMGKIITANWFIPKFEHISFGGLYTIFRFIEKLGKEGVTNRIIIYGDKEIDEKWLNSQITQNFPDLKNYKIISYHTQENNPSQLPESDIAFCTLWDSAYIMLRFNKTKRKYYFIQDYEPLFFPAGPISALSESTYRFGFKGIINTRGLLEVIQSRHGMEAMSFTPGINRNVYNPSSHEKKSSKTKIFFYGRPTKPRNAFDLGAETIKQLLKKYGERIEVVIAGAEWDESLYGLEEQITNLGLIRTIEEVADLYRSCDIGFCFMLTRHPSYQPIEFMASGVATVVNMNESNLWLLKDGENCLISEPSPKAMAATIGELVENTNLTKKIVENGYKTVDKLSWEGALDNIWNFIKN